MDCEERSLFARKGELEARNIECMLSDADMRTTSRGTGFLVAWLRWARRRGAFFRRRVELSSERSPNRASPHLTPRESGAGTMPCAKKRPPCGREDCAPCFERSLFARKAELEARNIECMLSDADMRTTSRGTKVYVAWLCMACWHAWEAVPNSVVGGGKGCPYCGGTNTDLCGYEDCTDCEKRSLLIWKDALAARGITCDLPDETMRRTPASSGLYVPWTCSISKHAWTAPPNEVCRPGKCCGYCAGGAKPPCGSDACEICMARSLYACKVDLADRMIASLLDDDAMKHTSRRTGDKLPWCCLVCENRWDAQANNVVGSGCGCPGCNTPGSTEKTVRDAVRAMDLGDVGTSVDDGEWTPPSGVDGNTRYRFDIHANVVDDDGCERSFVVEVDGEQHFGPVFFSGSTPTDHDKQLCADVAKMAWAVKRGVPVVRVPTSVVAWGSTEREHDWIAKLTELCRAAAEWTCSDDVPLFLYPGKEWMYAQHISDLEEVLSEHRSKRMRCD